MKKITISALSLAVTLGLSPLSHAAGFQLFEQGGSGLGNAFAGRPAAAEDASTVFSNPAGMSVLDNSQFVAAAHIILPSSRFKNSASTINASLGGAAITGGNGGDGGVLAAVPNLFVTHQFNDQLHFGLGISAPFGLATDYDSGWVGRYHGLDTDLRTVNINPSISYRINEQWSIGGGINAMHADLREYTNALDSGGICASFATNPTLAAVGGPATAAACGGAGLAANTVATDSHIKLEGDDWGYGFNIGVLFQPSHNTRVGIAYRSKVSLNVRGDADFTVDPVFRAQMNGNLTGGFAALFTDTKFKAKIDLPETLSIGSFQRVNNRWDMMGDISWTNWSRFETLRADFDNPVQSDLVQPENWEDTFRVALGITYHYTPEWDFRFGYAYDQSAIDRSSDRGPRIPDNDRNWLSFGMNYNPSDAIQLSLNYAHLFIEDGNSRFADATTGHILQGEFETDVNILSGQVSWVF